MKGANTKRRKQSIQIQTLSIQIERFTEVVVRVQRVWRSAIACKRAKMKAVIALWDEEESLVVKTLVKHGEH